MLQRKNPTAAAGYLYILGTVAGVLSVILIGPVLDEPLSLLSSPKAEIRLTLSALAVLTMGLALALIPAVLYPILKKSHPVLASGYLVFRGALETFTYLISVLGWFFLISLSRSEAEVSSGLQEIYPVLLDGEFISEITTIVFVLGAVMFYFVLFEARLIPRWISGWGLISTLPYLAAGSLVMFGVFDHMSTADTLLRIPLAIQEMVLAVWLIVKGINLNST